VVNVPAKRGRTRPARLRQEPEAVTWAREKSGLTKRALADLIGISEQLMGEIESGWRSATPANLTRIAEVLRCPAVLLERKPTPTAVKETEEADWLRDATLVARCATCGSTAVNLAAMY
jgi:transcriptional regulator with XRE-family HTH domain